MNKIGILAFGSLISDPGREIEEATESRIPQVLTDFKIEFSRKSQKRFLAPTLAVDESGSAVLATLLVFKDGVDIDEAKNMLFRREINEVGVSDVRYRITEWMEIKESKATDLCDVVLYTSIFPNIRIPKANELAILAVNSAMDKKNHSGRKRRDGIQYLYDVKSIGIRTPLMESYEEEILKLLQVETLEKALQKTSFNH